MRLPIDSEPRLRTTIETEASQKPEFLGIINGDPHVKTFDDGQTKIGLRTDTASGDNTPTLYIRSGAKLFKFNLEEAS